VVSGGDPRVEAVGLSVAPVGGLKVGALRYFDATGPLADRLLDVLGGPLPAPLRAARRVVGGSGAELILAWRSPTETLLITPDAAAFAAIASRMADHAALGCLVEQTGGVCLWQASGARTRELLERVGSVASMPGLNEARTSRIAELAVLALCVHEDRVMLLVERVHGEHLIAWIRDTAADFQ
jgi:sarcosine oxidase gamma subunit